MDIFVGAGADAVDETARIGGRLRKVKAVDWAEALWLKRRQITWHACPERPVPGP